MNAQVLTGFPKRLVAKGFLNEQQAYDALHKASEANKALGRYLIDNKLVSAINAALAASEEFGIPLVDLDALDADLAPIKDVSEKLIRKHHAVPLYRRGKTLFVGISDPTNLQALDQFRFHTQTITEPVLVEDDKLERFIDVTLDAISPSMTDIGDDDLDDLDISAEDDSSDAEVDTTGVDEAPIVRFVNKILLDAIRTGVSDIHFEPYEKKYRIRVRQDGLMREVANPPVALGNRIAARLKVMARLDISERRVPQDGRIKMNLSRTRSIDFRVNTLPTLHGEKAVLRILDSAATQIGIEQLGFDPDQKEHFIKAITRPHGMILVTGPTGSGKTVTLYTALNHLNSGETNISTAEDPCEMNIMGINQVNINIKAGLDFPKALRAFLRQDPDIIMVGEIRDLETAEISVKAAQTGHLVLSTLHTNDAPQTLVRLTNMGIPTFNIASSVELIIAQRLIRKLCPHCKETVDIPKEALLEQGFTEADVAAGIEVFHPVGCTQCTEGYRGRLGIFQVMPVTEKMGRIIMDGGNAIAIADQAAAEGVRDLRQSGL